MVSGMARKASERGWENLEEVEAVVAALFML